MPAVMPTSLQPAVRALLAALLSVSLLLLAAGFRLALERSMPLHMLLQMPMLLGAGVACSYAISCIAGDPQNPPGRPNWLQRGIARWSAACGRGMDEYGIIGLTYFLLLSAYWMVPKALDDVLISPTTELLKFAGFFLAGLLLPGTLVRANRVIQLFFLGNFAWMMAIVGMLYQDPAVRLCNAYLLDDQVVAGQGLVVLSIAIPAFWGIHLIRSKNDKTQSIF